MSVERVLTDVEANNLALDIIGNEVFLSSYIHPEDINMIGMVFMPLGFAPTEIIEKVKTGEIEMIYEYYAEAGPRSINGYPGFMSFKTVNRPDWAVVKDLVTRLGEAMKGALLPVKPDDRNRPEPTEIQPGVVDRSNPDNA